MLVPDAPREKAATQPDERVILSTKEIVVTDRRIILPTKSYTASAIVSVKVQEKREKKPSWFSPRRINPWFAIGFGVIACGLAAAYFGMTGAGSEGFVTVIFVAIGVLCLVLGGALIYFGLMIPRDTPAPASYAVAFATVDGQRERIPGLSVDVARSVADAISLASTRGK